MEKTDEREKTTDTTVELVPVIPVIRVKPRKKKRYSSRSARRFGEIERRVSKSVHRVSRAVDNGVTTYLEKRDKSARRRRDGALVDFYENAAVGISQALSESSPVLSDFAETLNSRKTRKLIRRVVRAIPVF